MNLTLRSGAKGSGAGKLVTYPAKDVVRFVVLEMPIRSIRSSSQRRGADCV